MLAVRRPMQGTIVTHRRREGDAVAAGQQVAGDGSHEDGARHHGATRRHRAGVHVAPGDTVYEGQPLLCSRRPRSRRGRRRRRRTIDLDAIRPDLAEVLERHALTLDETRPEAVARRRKTNQRTARENIDDLSTPARSSSTARLRVAAQRRGARSRT